MNVIVAEWSASLPTTNEYKKFAPETEEDEIVGVPPLASLTDRVDVRRALGADTERLMFLYATVSQVRWYREVLRCNRRGLQHFGEDREARSDAGRYRDDESWPIAVNFYTGETSRLHGGECAALTLMHAADIHSVLAHPAYRAGAGR